MTSETISGKIIFLLTLLFFFSLDHSSSQSNHRQILLKFKSSFANSTSKVFNTWNSNNSICNFTGIVCNSDDSVKEISLSQQNLLGTLPFDSICALQSLEKLSLKSNFLYGTISNHLSNCTGLRYLDLGKNLFSGEVPDLSSLTRLEFLNMDQCKFSGMFPWKSIENLTELGYLSLGYNRFDKSPFPLEVLKLRNLYTLYLSKCSIEGKIPEEIGNLTLLERLQLDNNYLVGEISMGITRLTKIHELELYDNELSGVLPVGFRNLVNLAVFDVSNNSLEGDLSELRSLTRMEALHLYENGFSGSIPEEFGEFRFLKWFSIYDNKFTGELPPRIGSWAEFEYIDASENFLNGSIPPDMCKMGKMTNLLMLQNDFTGGLPENYAGCSSLVRLRVSNNSLSGRVPDGIWSLPNLRMIDLAMNRFEGRMAPNIGKAKSLAQLFLSNNQFSGELPEEITNVSSLVEIELLSNRFTCKIPSRIGELKKLNNLLLQDNRFSGAIPASLGSCVSLDEINLAGNTLSGHIPTSLGSLPSLNSLNLSSNKLSGVIPESLSSLKLSLIDLSNNVLIGRVPESLLLEAYKGSFAGNPGLCADRSKDLRQCTAVSHKSGELKVVVYCYIAGVVVLLLSLSVFLFVKLRQNYDESTINQGYSWDVKQFHVLKISEDEVLRSLKQENIIGKGGSGNVYKVDLGRGEQIAVKHMRKSDVDSDGWRRSRWSEYEAEVSALSLIRHKNVVKLYCSITSEHSNMLLYEYMPNGSLWDRLHTDRKIEMDWNVRYDIALGLARGWNTYIMEMKPKIADFGLARILQTEKVIDSLPVISGTHGYIAPEYGYTCNVTEKSDTYSFGVILMELATGKRPTEPEYGENKEIAQWVHNEMRSKYNIITLVDSSISKDAKEEAAKVLTIAVHCTMKVPTLRPAMRIVGIRGFAMTNPGKLANLKGQPNSTWSVATMSSEAISGKNKIIIFLTFLLFILDHSSSQSNQLQILLKFKSSFANSTSKVFNTWNSDNPICNFTGIVCNSDHSVKEINLSQQKLVGTLPFDSICALQSLETISLKSNLLYGTISHHLSNCTRLKYLDLGKNLFSGKVPDLSSLTRLEFLNMEQCKFSGMFPWKSIENLTGLGYLSLGDNLFDKSPFPLEVLKLRNLYWLYLSNSSIEGKIPEEIGNLTLLKRLELADNYLVGEIPMGITKLVKIQELELYDNELSGVLPVGFRNLVNLAKFDVSNNSLEGDLSELRFLTKMESLYLFENGFSGTIPKEFGEFRFLTRFSIYDNKFTGGLPPRIGSWAEFELIDASENFLNGSIPPDMCKMGKLRKLLILRTISLAGYLRITRVVLRWFG
ncbi:hypothetical protein OSB04_016208 [Centaurea solstitialis]|uniref:Protein kinase domain-containing protein n=1 Tax=Centaurea solstitialis TaxID=347529 RepID=A0AA38T0K0_9ASTR|nr:hypothetical protein OSB04_016208 [Centaurea solstitialis]